MTGKRGGRRYNEGGIRPLKVKLRSQTTVEEILAKTGKLAENTKYKITWIIRDMDMEGKKKGT